MYKNGTYVGNIYLITNNINDKKYVGQTVNEVYDRWSGHKHDSRRREYHTAIDRAIYKYGADSFTVALLEKIYAHSEDELHKKLNEREIFHIQQQHSTVHEDGYNITLGGNQQASTNKKTTYCFTRSGELIHVFDSRSDAGRFVGVRGEDISGAILRSGLCRGYYFATTPDFNLKTSCKKMSEIKVYAYDKSGNLLSKYNNCHEAANSINGDVFDIYNVCKGISTSYRGIIWRFEGDEFGSYRLPNKMTKRINRYSKDDIFISTYESIKEAATDCHVHSSNISAALSNNSVHKTSGGYKWYYANDPNQPDKTKIMSI